MLGAIGHSETKKLTAEIANGHLSVMAVSVVFFLDGLTGSPWGNWVLYTASPLRVFGSELGVQAPESFWNPLALRLMATRRPSRTAVPSS